MNLALLQGTTADATAPPTAQVPGYVSFILIVLLVVIVLAILAPVGVGIWMFIKRPDVGAAGKSWLDYGNFFIVAIGIASVLGAFLIAMVLTINLRLFKDATEILAVLTALFGVIGTLVGTFFGVKAGSDAAVQATNLAGEAITPTTGQPTVTTVSPPAGSPQVPLGTQPTATFNKDINPASLSNQSFQLKDSAGNPVPGEPVYNHTLKQATFQPTAALSAGTYTATITTDVRDLMNMPLNAEHTWSFTVA